MESLRIMSINYTFGIFTDEACVSPRMLDGLGNIIVTLNAGPCHQAIDNLVTNLDVSLYMPEISKH